MEAAPSRAEQAWGVAIGTTVLAVFIAAGALFGGAPGDRVGGLLLGGQLLIATPALLYIRNRRAVAATALLVVAVAQVIVGVSMIAIGAGATGVVIAINAILLIGWLLAAALFRA